jgi:hypothetical protein
MSPDDPSNKHSASALTADRAVSIGQLVVNLPVVGIVALGGFLAYLVKGPAWTALGVLLGIIPAWLWWSIMVPRWREWAKRRGTDEDETQLMGERRGLVWSRGSFFERTEFGSEHKSAAERRIKQSSVKKRCDAGLGRPIACGRLIFSTFWQIVVGLLMILLAYKAKATN